ncbi:hypothetical protein SLEP1_g6091 [Rubroshorea leprosula]|uniref:Uncharacterized protein n=1 Tax=Rubroshorea leprosula TaxID=152421 RepID=A0AAV5I2Y7_9ROSI|nr:hypothetical protein SLEP1_g6091 [Rubroshorea leprosula]
MGIMQNQQSLYCLKGLQQAETPTTANRYAIFALLQ